MTKSVTNVGYLDLVRGLRKKHSDIDIKAVIDIVDEVMRWVK